MSQRNVERLVTANAMLCEAGSHLEKADKAVAEMSKQMGLIDSSSRQIETIINTIDEIAFQTNILALNAVVEAARAGSAGLGFAVVADEVQNLAQRCSVAAHETTSLVQQSVDETSKGGVALQAGANAMVLVGTSTAQMKSTLEMVQQGSQEQSRGVEQISVALVEMEQITRQTAASAEQSAAASEKMESQAQILGKVVVRLRSMV